MMHLIIFHYRWNLGTDYIRQIALKLSARGQVAVWNPYQTASLKNLLFDKDLTASWLAPFSDRQVFYVPSVAAIPFQRFKTIYTLNQFINAVIFWLVYFVKYGFKKPDIWFFSPQFGQISKYMFFRRRLIYDRPDNFRSVDPNENRLLKNQDQEAIRSADFVFVNSPHRLDRIRKLNSNTFQIPWGLDSDLFINNKYIPLHPLFKKLEKPVIGFAGYINHRLDLPLVYDLIKKNPRWSFVFAGEVYNYSDSQKLTADFDHWWQRLGKLPNFHHVAVFDKKLLPGIIGGFDIGIIPYDIRQEFVKGSNPMKCYEYLAGGKPVVSTPIPALKPSAPEVALVSDGAGFSNKIKWFLRTNQKARIRNRLNLARAHTWDKHISSALLIINKHNEHK